MDTSFMSLSAKNAQNESEAGRQVRRKAPLTAAGSALPPRRGRPFLHARETPKESQRFLKYDIVGGLIQA
jgi:hypothetical protein